MGLNGLFPGAAPHEIAEVEWAQARCDALLTTTRLRIAAESDQRIE